MATVVANFCEEIVQAREKQFGSTGSKSCSSPPSNPKPASAAACTASSNQGIDKSKFIEARNAWCGDTSKRLDQSKDYAKYFEFELKKKEGGMCDKQDCIDTVNAMWNKCSDYSNRPEKNDDKALEGHNGPLRGNGQADGKCGNYTFILTDPKPKFPPGEDAKGQGGKPNEIGCAIVEGLKANRKDMDAAIEEYCNNDGHDLSGFKGDKKVGGVHIHVQGSVRTRGEAEWYEDVGTCRDFNNKLRKDDCKFALKKITDKCGPDGKNKGSHAGVYIYNCIAWSASTSLY